MDNIRVGSCFSGVGMWELALKYLNIPHTQNFFVEFDKFPVKSYKAIHGNVKNYGDITKVKGEQVEDIDLFFYSPPCQAFSVAGKGLGIKDNRGVLFNDSLRIINSKKPKICMMENVKGLTNKRHRDFFNHILNSLEQAGYINYYKVLNTKDYGVPQNRERIFIISIRNDICKGYEFPLPFDNGLRLKDVLEDEVDEKYYLSDEYLERFKDSLSNKELQHKIPKTGAYEVIGTTVNPEAKGTNSRHWVYSTDKLISTIDATTYKQPKQILDTNAINQIGMLNIKGNEQVRRIYSQEGISPTLNTMQGGNRQPKVLMGYKIRKLTPKECWRLQGIKDEDFEKAASVNSNTQLYKQAGNGVSVNVVMEILKKLQEFKYI